MNGVLVIDKPTGWTSHDVVSKVRRITGERSVGHLGTLDPLATGVLPLLLGKMTRLAQFFSDADKEYEGEIRLGYSTSTYDAEGERTSELKPVAVDLESIRVASRAFEGRFPQTPPPFSAKKISGIPAYRLARKQKAVELKPVMVEVKEIEVLGLVEDRVSFRAQVRAGTYIRSIAHELGQALGTGGHLASLRRTRSGEFTLADATSLERLGEAAEDHNFDSVSVPIRRLLPELPSVTASEEQLVRVCHGNSVNLAELSRAKTIKVFSRDNELVAIAERVAGTLFQPKVVICP
jgi:tRNA pseudouridine55 synthase